MATIPPQFFRASQIYFFCVLDYGRRRWRRWWCRVQPHTVEDVFRDFKVRRNGMIKALTTGNIWSLALRFVFSSSFIVVKNLNFLICLLFGRCSGVLPTLQSRWVPFRDLFVGLMKVTIFIVCVFELSLLALFCWVLNDALGVLIVSLNYER